MDSAETKRLMAYQIITELCEARKVDTLALLQRHIKRAIEELTDAHEPEDQYVDLDYLRKRKALIDAFGNEAAVDALFAVFQQKDDS